LPHGDLDCVVDLLPRLRETGHQAGEHERLRLAPALRQATLDEQDVEPLLHTSHCRGIVKTLAQLMPRGRVHRLQRI
jgi:hypothetical protein